MFRNRMAEVRPMLRVARHLTNLALAATLSAGFISRPEPAMAGSAGTIIVGNDRGGFIRSRLAELRRIRANHQRVEIRGKVCFSTCTMYLGLENLCVSPDTTFGFHGPAMALGRLTPAQFDYLSRVIAAHYPPPVADWYLREGRNRVSGLYRIKGEDLIRLGVAACPVVASGFR